MKLINTLLAVQRPVFLLVLAISCAVFVHPIFWIGATLLVFDIRARIHEYVFFVDLPFNTPLAYRLRKSWCSRGVAEAIWPRQAKRYYHHLGYRWYHILPDGGLRVWLSPRFWRNVIIGRPL
jgi:hypothetical protein